LYPASSSSILGIFDTMYCTISKVWNYTTSFNNCNSNFTTFFYSSCWIVIWFNFLCKFWVSMQFMFILILSLLLEKKFDLHI
jgi:hypothetical protein